VVESFGRHISLSILSNKFHFYKRKKGRKVIIKTEEKKLILQVVGVLIGAGSSVLG
jgi:hypothetical protein